jgi:Leucine-rich repeat (LRR) protein
MLKRPVMLDVTLPSQSGKKMADIVPALQAVAANIVLLNLADNGLIEQDLTFLKQLPNLEKLRLEKNPIGDGIGGLLLELEHLNAVNLNETKISKATLDILHQNPAIKRIYCWKTAAE